MKVLVTGGTGSLGRALVKHLAARHEVTVLSRDAHKQATLLRELHEHDLQARFVLGDICDPVATANACHQQDVIIQAAALKRIERGESDPEEYLRVNVTGALAIAHRALEYGVGKALLICTDKAVQPLNTYGVTKALAERAWTKAGRPWATTQFAAIRYGNVVNSDGAVLEVWRAQTQKHQRLLVRAPEPTRFVLTIAQALALVTEALEIMQDGQILIPRALPAISMWAMARLFQPEYLWQREPLTTGEKQHESLLAEGEYAYPASPHLAYVTTQPINQPLLERAQFQSNTASRLPLPELADLLDMPGVGHELSYHSRIGEQLVAA